MIRWKQACALLALGVAMATLPGEASAQQAPARPQPAQAQAAAPAKPAVLRARDLMTPQERQAYRQSMRAARNDPARKQQLRSQWRETLAQRATARGGVLAEPAMAKPGMKGNKETNAPERRPAAPPRAP